MSCGRRRRRGALLFDEGPCESDEGEHGAGDGVRVDGRVGDRMLREEVPGNEGETMTNRAEDLGFVHTRKAFCWSLWHCSRKILRGQGDALVRIVDMASRNCSRTNTSAGAMLVACAHGISTSRIGVADVGTPSVRATNS